MRNIAVSVPQINPSRPVSRPTRRAACWRLIRPGGFPVCVPQGSKLVPRLDCGERVQTSRWQSERGDACAPGSIWTLEKEHLRWTGQIPTSDTASGGRLGRAGLPPVGAVTTLKYGEQTVLYQNQAVVSQKSRPRSRAEMAKGMNWRKAGLARKLTGDALDGGLRFVPTTKGQKKAARRREKKKLYGFFKDRKPDPVRHVDPKDWKPTK